LKLALILIAVGGAASDLGGTDDEEIQRNDLVIIRQVAGVTDDIPRARGYDFSFARDADQQLNRAGVEALKTSPVGNKKKFQS